MAGKAGRGRRAGRIGRPAALTELRRGVFDSLASHVAVLDARGVILDVNARWRKFAEENGGRGDFVGVNYLAVCRAASGDRSAEAAAAEAGIRDVIAGRAEQFVLDYPCHSPQERAWFTLRVTPFVGGPPARAVVAHEDISHRVCIERDLRIACRELLFAREDDLRRLANSLHENVAQKVAGLHLVAEAHRRAAPGPMAASLRDLLSKKQTEALVREICDLSYQLYPPTLELLGLTPSLWRLVEDVQPPASVDFVHSPRIQKARFPGDVEVSMFRIAQQALDLAIRPGQATAIQMRLAYSRGQLMLTIAADAVGIEDPDRLPGVAVMRQRARAVGGRLEVTRRGRRMKILAAVPVRAEPAR